jgi:tetratricopeptide (TPR) repeat protein
MNFIPKRSTAFFTFFVFLFFLVVNIYSTDPLGQNRTEEILKEAEYLYQSGEYEQALAGFQSARSLTEDKDILAFIYLKLSQVYYKMENQKNSEDMLRRMFELDSEIKIDESQFDAGYSMIYKKVNAEYWFSFRVGDEQKKKEDRKIIEKLSRKPDKKKKKLIPILLISGVVVAVVVMAVLLWQKGGEERRGNLSIFNRSDTYISVVIGSQSKRVDANSSLTILLKEGSHEVVISYQGQTAIFMVEIVFEKTTVLIWDGWNVQNKNKREHKNLM